MIPKARYWIILFITLLSLALVAWFAPSQPIDPWKLFSLKKIASLILALAIIQELGSALAQYLGVRTSAILTGFLGGLVSSTAATASLARQSRFDSRTNDNSSEMLTFLSATVAMLFEAMALVFMGLTERHSAVFVIFVGPILATAILIIAQYRTLSLEGRPSQQITAFQILPILKLTLFIVAILAVSKVFQNLFGENGLLILTSIVSLFEIHGSIIANVQLHESGAVTINFLCSLLAVSVAASYVSKLFLIFSLGRPTLRWSALKAIFFVFCSLFASWMMAINFI